MYRRRRYFHQDRTGHYPLKLMTDYQNILCDETIYLKYRNMISPRDISISDIIEHLSLIYDIKAADNERFIKHYDTFFATHKNHQKDGDLYIVSPLIPNQNNDKIEVYLYAKEEGKNFIINGTPSLFAERLARDIAIIRGLTEEELDKKELVYNYMEALSNYYVK